MRGIDQWKNSTFEWLLGLACTDLIRSPADGHYGSGHCQNPSMSHAGRRQEPAAMSNRCCCWRYYGSLRLYAFPY